MGPHQFSDVTSNLAHVRSLRNPDNAVILTEEEAETKWCPHSGFLRRTRTRA